MVEPFFFGLGLVNSICLIAIFMTRRWNLALLEKVGWLYLLLALPAVYGLVLVQQEHASLQYTIFLVIFLAFLLIEALYDWIWKIPFREEMNWPALVPYAALYLASTYGFVVMPWRASPQQRIIMLALFVAQILANVLTHPRSLKMPSSRG
ncbi:MAG: hypothetical protein WAQ75_09340 [Propionicimonas sp.]